MKKTLLPVAAALALATCAAFAQPGPGYGAGMMGGYGSGYGPGMMGGYGPGYGGMGGYGGGLASLKLTTEQSEKIAAIQEESRKKNWGAMGDMRAEMFKLRQMYTAENLDTKGVDEQQKKVDDLRRKMLTSRLESQKQIEAVLTPEQRKQFHQYRPRWMNEADGE
jgi:Spy/CpxP family protein refolding chaperone